MIKYPFLAQNCNKYPPKNVVFNKKSRSSASLTSIDFCYCLDVILTWFVLVWSTFCQFARTYVSQLYFPEGPTKSGLRVISPH